MVKLQTIDDIRQLGTILSVWAHPDDESFTAAGTMMAAVSNGQTVICLTATKGEQGKFNPAKWSRETLGESRAQELQEALKIIGIKEHHWLGYRDGACDQVDEEEAVGKIAAFIEQYKPDTILTFGPEGMTGHPDHQSVSRWVSQAVQRRNSKPAIYHAAVTTEQYERYLRDLDQKINFFFNIDQPPLCDVETCELCFTLPPELCRRKCEALAAMPSQTETMFRSFDKDTLTSWFNEETFKRAA